jgi:hypothetical protein
MNAVTPLAQKFSPQGSDNTPASSVGLLSGRVDLYPCTVIFPASPAIALTPKITFFVSLNDYAQPLIKIRGYVSCAGVQR